MKNFQVFYRTVLIGPTMSLKQVIAICAFLLLCSRRALCDNCRDRIRVKCDGGPVAVGLTKDETEALIKGHDAYKKILYNSDTSVEWDHELQSAAQSWADECREDKNECRSSDNYKTVYQLVTKNKNGNFTDVARQLFNDLSAPDTRTTTFKHDIDRVGCGFKKVLRSNCKRYRSSNVCSLWHVSYLVCNYAATSESVSV